MIPSLIRCVKHSALVIVQTYRQRTRTSTDERGRIYIIGVHPTADADEQDTGQRCTALDFHQHVYYDGPHGKLVGRYVRPASLPPAPSPFHYISFPQQNRVTRSSLSRPLGVAA